MKEIQVGSVVISKKGRDKGMLLVVTGFEGNRVLTVNGKNRKADKPKKKNSKHLLIKDDGFIPEIPIKVKKGEKIGNRTVKRLLAEKSKQEE